MKKSFSILGIEKDTNLKNVIKHFRCGLKSTILGKFYFEDNLGINRDIVDSLFKGLGAVSPPQSNFAFSGRKRQKSKKCY